MQDFNVVLGRPFGSLTILQITVGRAMKAVVVLRGLIIEWVSVKAYHEDTHFESDKLDLWLPTRYRVFNTITCNARSAMMHYSTSEPIIIRQYLGWLNSYKLLFSSPCVKCKKLLNEFSPPTFRDFRLLEPYHENCRT